MHHSTPWPSWDSANWDVCSCNGGQGMGQLPGLTTIQARWTAYKWGSFESGNPNECYERPIDVLAEAFCEILARRVDSVSPERALIGQPVDVVINGSGFGTGTPTVSAGSGITVSNVQLINSPCPLHHRDECSRGKSRRFRDYFPGPDDDHLR